MFTTVSLMTVFADSVPAGANPGQGGMLKLFIPFILIMVVMFFFSARSQKKQQAQRQEMLGKLMKGTRVLLAGGIYGVIAEVREGSFLVEIADKVRIEVEKNGVSQVAADKNASADEKK